MKSPLVEALRTATEAADGKAESESDAAPVEQSELPKPEPDVGPKRVLLDEDAADADELTLHGSTDVLVIEEPTNDPEAVDGDEDAIDLGDTNVMRVNQPSVDGAAAALLHGGSKQSWFSLARLGRLTPFYCIVLAAAAAGTYFVMDDIGIGGPGLASTTTQLGQRQLGAVEVPEPQGPVQRFPLLETGRPGKTVTAPANEEARKP